MKLSSSFKSNFIYIVALLHILLFSYAAASKLLDFQNFQVQLGQSPLLSAFAVTVSVAVPMVEFILVLMLMLPRFRLIGLYGSFVLMTMFSAYIVIVLNFSSFTPCSCGGILEKMSWTEHLIFNIVFVVISAIAIILHSKTRFVYGFLAILFTSGITFIIALFLMSEDIIQHRNNFVRRLPDQFSKEHDIDLGFNSYYFAGAVNGKVYLGNVTAPLLLTETDTMLKSKKEIVITLSSINFPFRSLNIQVYSKYFLASDGTVPVIFRGKTGQWKATQIPGIKYAFSNPVFTDSISTAFRTHKKNLESVLATATFTSNRVKRNPALLQKQIDGRFDTDGVLNYDPYTNQLVYIYYYRNQYIVADSKLNLIHRGNTIDTTTKANIKVAFIKDRNEKKFSAPPMTVNKNAYVYKGLLFVNAALMGKYESEKMWKQASIIDVYDYKNRSYVVSFYVYNIDGERLTDFAIQGNNFYGIVGSHLVSYKMSNIVTRRYSEKK
ncbi:MauE/DoxX family redox-associated membrane protein [Flavobacterium sp. UBA7682]|uniref:MauE/DoxX family redox-associated membrane protein n=1 Tax=Flavobacterium sp. UBA7682 TaxID=1946560 RepID=UPI0025B9BE1A|nr:MauE/DoxX family redox-associated membrane protein [Flavobacterium sp. UBA7682]